MIEGYYDAETNNVSPCQNNMQKELLGFIQMASQNLASPNSCDYDTIAMSFMQNIEMLKLNKEKEDVIKNWPYKIARVSGKNLWRTHVADETKKDKRRQITAKSETELHDKMYDEWKKQCKSVKEYFYQFLDERLESGQIKANTWERMDVAFRKSFSSIADTPLERITDDDVTQMIEDICKSNPSTAEYANARNCIKQFFLWARRYKYSEVHVNDALQLAQISPKKQCKKKVKRDSDEVWSDDELCVVVPHLISDKNDLRAMAMLLDFVTGVRIGELCALKSEDIQGQTIIIRRSEHKYKKSSGKGYDYIVEDVEENDDDNKAVKTEAAYRRIIVPTEAEWILQYLKSKARDGEYLFRNVKGKRYTSCALRSFWHDYLLALGVKYKKPHAIRKTYASILLDNNADETFVTKQSGHTDISTTERFYHRDRRNIEKKVEILDAMDEFRIFGKVTQGHTI